jgi:hypothetical protein
MFRPNLGSIAILCISFLCIVSFLKIDAFGALSITEKRELKIELRTRDISKIKSRLIRIAAESEGEGSDDYKLCMRILELQSGDDWTEHRVELNRALREVLSEMQSKFPGYLESEQADKVQQLVLMGQLYEKYLYDRKSAKQCYLKVVRRHLWGKSLPETVEDWRYTLTDAQYSSDLSVEEQYSIKRLLVLNEQPLVVNKRLLAAIDQKIMEAEQEFNRPQQVEPFEPNLPLDELRQKFLEGNGGQQ